MTSEPWGSRLQRWAWPALAVYWPLMFVSTHWPDVRVSIETPAVPFDKLAHYGLYAGLATLLGLVQGLLGATAPQELLRRKRRPQWLAWSGLELGYAVFDELTQPLFLRDFEWLDLLADGLGLCTVVSGAWALARWQAQASETAAAPDA